MGDWETGRQQRHDGGKPKRKKRAKTYNRAMRERAIWGNKGITSNTSLNQKAPPPTRLSSSSRVGAVFFLMPTPWLPSGHKRQETLVCAAEVIVCSATPADRFVMVTV